MKKIILYSTIISLSFINCSKKDTENSSDKNLNAIDQHQNPVVDTSETEIKFEEEMYDFKDIKKGENATHIFSFTNVGSKPLIITEVKPACGCTTPEYTNTPVAPGQKGSITVTFNSSNFEGPVKKNVIVSGNFEKKDLQFQANVK
ncbi:DUF1573 domain-containing protein [Apibacter muscae]|uniref:DUF1573 domain-containing protein n=1 Tax=Apibacter muscae TaxID=2509004 RepID=A0A563DK93_9FLAO|nr:DUF1573 domain-containing protein [Apibacter muscae]TWP30625.1 DUF1573 domain-containing protein [Apibacter muscae]TWP31461.1 DUF1573 domain-containing protein [Apibacter muscae]